jgi:hypothetical protein
VSNLVFVGLSTGAQQVLSGAAPASPALVGSGRLPFGCRALDAGTTDGVAYLTRPWIASVMAVDLVSGDRVFIAR